MIRTTKVPVKTFFMGAFQRLRTLRELSISDDTLAFFDHDGLAGVNVAESIDLPVRPHDFDSVGPGFLAQSERQNQFAGRKIPAGFEHLRLLVPAGSDFHHGSDAIAIAFCTMQLNAERIVSGAIIAKQQSWSCIGHHDQIEVAVLIDVGVSGAPCHTRSIERLPHLFRDFGELSITKIAKQVRWLTILDALLHAFDVFFDMTVGDENVLPTIEIV